MAIKAKKGKAVKAEPKVKEEEAEAPASADEEEGSALKPMKKRKARTAKLRRDNRKKREQEALEAEGKDNVKEEPQEDEEEYMDKRLFVGNLPKSVKEQELEDLFARFGEVHRVRLICSCRGIFRGSAFITFEDESGVNGALNVSGMEFKGQDLLVKKATPPPVKTPLKVQVTGLPFTLPEKQLRKEFKPCGEIAKVQMLTHWETGKFNGKAFIEFKNSAAAEAALKKSGSNVGGRDIVVKYALPKKKLPRREKDKVANDSPAPEAAKGKKRTLPDAEASTKKKKKKKASA